MIEFNIQLPWDKRQVIYTRDTRGVITESISIVKNSKGPRRVELTTITYENFNMAKQIISNDLKRNVVDGVANTFVTFGSATLTGLSGLALLLEFNRTEPVPIFVGLSLVVFLGLCAWQYGEKAWNNVYDVSFANRRLNRLRTTIESC